MEFDIRKAQAEDMDLASILKKLQKGESQGPHYVLVEGALYYITELPNVSLRLMVPESIKDQVMQQYHDQCAHWGMDKTYDLIRRKYHWVGLYQDVVGYVDQCVTCKQRSQKKIKSPLQQMDSVHFPFQKIGVDTCGPYPTTLLGNKYCVTFVDWYSGWAEAFAVPDKTAETVGKLLLDEVVPRHSCPLEIVSDNGTEFVNQVFSTLSKELHIKHV